MKLMGITIIPRGPQLVDGLGTGGGLSVDLVVRCRRIVPGALSLTHGP